MSTYSRVFVPVLFSLMAITLIGGFFQHNIIVMACEPVEDRMQCALRAQSRVSD